MRVYATALFASMAVALAAGNVALADEEFSLVIDPFLGTASLRNDSSANLSLDSYLLTAGASVLNPATWGSLTDAEQPGWVETSSAANRVGELNLFNSLSFQPGQSIGIGSPYIPFAPSAFGEVEPGFDTLRLAYTVAGETSARVGDVEFSSRNTLVLLVDPSNGSSSLVNQSNFDIELDSYFVSSIADVLDPTGWNELSESDSGWISSTGQPNRLFEGRLSGSNFLTANGGSLAIGAPVDFTLLSDETDLRFQFTIASSPTMITGGVLFVAPNSSVELLGDTNNDGVVNTLDIDPFVLLLTNPAGYAAAFPGVDTLAVGDINMDAVVNTLDIDPFVALLTSGSLVSGSNAVPEPSTLVTVMLSVVTFSTVLRRTGRRSR